MKFLRWLTHRLEQLPGGEMASPKPSSFQKFYRYWHNWSQSRCESICAWLKLDQAVDLFLYPKVSRRKVRSSTCLLSWFLLCLALVSLTSAIGYRFYNDPQLAIGTTAPLTLKAPADAKIIDIRTTEERRQAARTAAVPVLKIDPTIDQANERHLQRLLAQGEQLRQEAGEFPFITSPLLSIATQRYLLQTSEAEWQETIARVDQSSMADMPITGSGTTSGRVSGTDSGIGSADSSASPSIPTQSAGQVESMDEPANKPANQPANQPASGQIRESTAINAPSVQELAILDLQNYRRIYSAEDFLILQDTIAQARLTFAKVNAILKPTDSPSEPSQFYDNRLILMTDREWSQTKETVRKTLKRMLSQGIAAGLPEPHLANAIKVHLDSTLPASLIPLATKLLLRTVQPNLVEDVAMTKQRAERAAQEVPDVVIEIRQGEEIIRSGDIITASDFAVLDHFGLSLRGINWWGLVGFVGLIATAIALFLWVEQRFHPGLRRRDYLLILLLLLSTPLILATNLPATNLPAIALLIGSFYGSAIGGTAIALLSFLLPIGMEANQANLVLCAAWGSLVGAVMAGRLRSREEIAKLGGIVGLIQGIIYLIVNLTVTASPVWYILLKDAGLQALMGVAWSIVALGVSPYLEQVFDLITPVRLAELSNPNRPLLMRLASEAPGTFQHTLFVATLAEAAARQLGCNIELVRAGTLYHDIGKMHDPQGFIENQMGGPNKHDEIDNPWISANIIKRHVAEGLSMARRCRLPTAIQAFIPEHQGTMAIAYFHHQALQRAKTDQSIIVRDADFCYDGPIPQSRETGIVMLADSCEAALRSLKDSTPEEALQMVNRILRARWQDNQLIESGLTRAEMSQIAEIFVQVWLQFNHKRIAYPKLRGGG